MADSPTAETVSVETEDGSTIDAAIRGSGPHGLVLVRGAESGTDAWQAEVPEFVAHGLTVMVPALTDPSDVERTMREVAASVAVLRGRGARAVSVLGATSGAEAAAEAVMAGLLGGLHTLILMAPATLSGPVGLATGRVIFVTADEDLATITAMKQRTIAPDAIEVTLYGGDYPALTLFESPHRDALLKRIRGALPPDPA